MNITRIYTIGDTTAVKEEFNIQASIQYFAFQHFWLLVAAVAN